MYGILVICLLLRPMVFSSDDKTTDFQHPNDVPERRAKNGVYMGCYPQECLKVGYYEVLLESTTPDSCIAACKRNGFKIAALYNRTECACSCEQRCPFTLPDESYTESYCGLPCKYDHARFCGGFIGASFFYVVKSAKTWERKCSKVTTDGTVGLPAVEAPGTSVHIAIPIFIPIAISLIIIVVGILIYHRLSKHTGESPIRVKERANNQSRDNGLQDKSDSGSNPSMKNRLETLVGEVLYEDPDKKVSSATTADSELSNEYLAPFQGVPLKNSSSDHDYNYPDMPNVGLVQAPLSARRANGDGYIVMDRDPQDRPTAGSKVYYSSRISCSQDGMGSSEIPGSDSLRIPKPLMKEERGSVENPESHVYYSANSVHACDENEDGAYIILDES